MIFLTRQDIEIMNKLAIENYGGLYGIRDDTLLEGAIARPQNLYFYENAGIFELASCYAFAIAKNHPFLDGNKRTAFFAMVQFLENNDITINIETQQAVDLMLDIATDKMTIKQVADFLRSLSGSNHPVEN